MRPILLIVASLFQGPSALAQDYPARPIELVVPIGGTDIRVMSTGSRSSRLRDAEFAARIGKDGGRVLTVAPAGQAKFLQDEIELGDAGYPIRRWG